MKTEIFYAPSYSLAVVSLAPGEVIQAESGAMVSMTEGVDMQTSSKGGLLKGLKRAALGGEPMFIHRLVLQAHLPNVAGERRGHGDLGFALGGECVDATRRASASRSAGSRSATDR